MRGVAQRFSRPRGIAALWFGLLGGPAAWSLHLALSYSLVRYVCMGGPVWLLHLATLAGLLLAGAAGWTAWCSWRDTGRPRETTGSGVEGRSRFMALAGLMFSVFSFAVILVAGVPNFILEPCPLGP